MSKIIISSRNKDTGEKLRKGKVYVCVVGR